MFYTYAHYRADDNRIFYIGKGKDRRYRSHGNRNHHWHNIVNKHGMVSEILAVWKTEKEALDHERLLISIFRDMGESLANICDGGEANTGARHTDASKELLRKAHTGARRTADHCEKISKSLMGRKLTDVWKSNLSKARIGMKSPKSYIPIYCETLDVKFASVTLASALTGLDKSHIVKVCKGKIPHIKGYVFRYD